MAPEVPSEISVFRARNDLMFALRVSANRSFFGSEIEKTAVPLQLEMLLIIKKIVFI